MKKIINKKLYDTDTAKEVTTHNNGLGWGDFYFINETLYQKRTGEFFLFGHGGAMTEYGEHRFGSWTSGSNIFPLTEDEAQEWVAEYCDADLYIKIFGEVEE